MATETEEAEQPECRYCGDPVDHLEPGHYKSPGDKFAHAECVADHCYEDREKVATEEGVFRIKSVTIMKTVGTKEELLDSYWQAECPVCYRTHETDDHSEDVRTDLIDQVCECCGAEWLPPSDWIEDCEICGTSHRESRDCKPLSMREPFPDPDEHRYECAKCEWSGEGDEFGNPDGYCPECDSAAVRALKVATDGGERLGDGVEQTDPVAAMTDAIENHYDDDKCGAPLGRVVEEMLGDPSIDVGDVGHALREGYFHGVIYQPSQSTVARVATDGGVTRPAVCVDTLEYDGKETHQDTIEGKVTRHYYECPSCGHPITTWMDCPECLWYDEGVWSRTLSKREDQDE